MRKIKAFSLAEILIAVTFMGVIASLTLPTMYGSITVKERKHAYEQAYSRLQSVINELPEGTQYSAHEATGQAVWKALNDSLPVVGYIDPSLTGVISTSVRSGNLKTGARWWESSYSTTIGMATSDSDRVVRQNGYSPWIITENGMAFKINAWSLDITNTGIQGTCATAMEMNNAINKGSDSSVRNHASHMACLDVVVDVNGLDKGPNRLPSGNIINKVDMDKEINNADWYQIYIVLGSAQNNQQFVLSSGPEGLTEYWMKHPKKEDN